MTQGRKAFRSWTCWKHDMKVTFMSADELWLNLRRAADLMLDCEGIAMLVEGIPRFPCGNAGGMGFWGLRGPLLLFFLCFLVSAGGLVFLRGFRCCWCCTRRLLSPRRKLSFKLNIEKPWAKMGKLRKLWKYSSFLSCLASVGSTSYSCLRNKFCTNSAGFYPITAFP